MMRREWRSNQRGGVLLDLVLVSALIILGAFVLYSAGITFGDLLSGAGRFFGV